MSDLSPEFYKKLLEVSASVGMQPEQILNIMALESSVSSSAINKDSGAVGLTQFIPSTLRSVGYTGSSYDFAKEPGEVQLEYIEKYIKRVSGGKPLKSATQLYVANLLPIALRLPGVIQEDPNTIICSKNLDKPHLPGISIEKEKKYYDANSGLDTDHDGNITYGDLQTKLKQVASWKPYKKSLNELAKYTGYNPKEKTQVQETQLAQKEPTKPKEIGFIATIENLLNDLLQRIRTAERKDKQLYKTFLPNNNFLIQVTAKDHFDAIEFSRILCLALEEELLAKAYTHINSNEVEVECNIYGAQKECFSATKQLIESIAETFKDATKKIGSIDIKTNLIINKKSSYQQITGLTAEKAYRRFLLKFALGK